MHTGVLEVVFKFHRWPDGLEEGTEWLDCAVSVMQPLIFEHASTARKQGHLEFGPYIRQVSSVPG